MALNVAEGVIKVLELLGVRFIFGLPGSQTSPLYDALYSSGIRHILTRHEQAAAYMADAYAKFTGKLGVCDGTGGPGATNLLTGIATSWTDGVPVLALTGQQPLEHLGKGAFQELDHVAIFSPLTKFSRRLLKPDKTIETILEAYRAATWGRPGPVHVDLPLDVQTQIISRRELERLERGFLLPPRPKPSGNPEAVKDAALLLLEASRPLIIAGGGVHYSGEGAWTQLRSLAEYLEVPVVTTFNGRGSFPEDHPLSAGRMGVYSPAYTSRLLSEADLILAVGCRFAALSTRRWSNINPESTLIHIDIDPNVIGRNYSTRVGIVGDAGTVLEAILEEVKSLGKPRATERGEWLRLLEEAKESWKRTSLHRRVYSNEKPIKPQRVCYEIRRFFNRETVFTLDAGNNKMWAATFLEVYEPRTWIQSGCFGPMGYALPAAISCKLADNRRQVVAICGDGGFYMSLHELSTATQEGAPIIVCIFNDGALGTIKHLQLSRYGGRLVSVDLENPSFAKVAEAFNCRGIEVERPNQIKPALKEGVEANREGQPAVIDIHIDGAEPLPS